MESFQYPELLQSDGFFDDSGKLASVDLWWLEDGGTVVNVDDLPQEDLDIWLREGGRFERSLDPPNVIAGLRLLILLGHGPRGDNKLPLPTSKKAFDSITRTFDLPRSFLQTLQRGTMAHYSVRMETPSRTGYVLQTNGSQSGTFSLALSHDSNTEISRGLLWAVDLNEPDGLKQLRSQLLNAHHLIEFPLLAVTMFLNNKAQLICHKIQDCKDSLVKIEDETGIRRDDVDDGTAHFEHLELGKLTRTLTRLTSKLVHHKYNCQLQQSMIGFLQDTNMSHVYSDASATDKKTRKAIEEKLAYLRSWVQFNELRAAYLTDRVDSQKQTVYSLISQRDNALNLRIASKMENDGKEMKLIANTTGEVAILAAKDSAAMRIIADLTMVFLPATYVVTLFDSPFFDFENGATASRELWVYVVVTLILTALVRLLWYWSSRHRTSRILKSHKDQTRDTEGDPATSLSLLTSMFRVQGARTS